MLAHLCARRRAAEACSLVALAVACLATRPVHAETLFDALQQTLDHSPSLAARRAALAAQSEAIVQAQVEGRPYVTVLTGYTENIRYQLPSIFNPDRRVRAEIAVDVPLYLGGRVRNAVQNEANLYRAGWEDLQFQTSDLLREAVVAFANVLRDQAVVDLADNEVSNLERNLIEARARFRIGDLTKTDVAQSEARLALARADASESRATLVRSREEYVAIVGSRPDMLEQPHLELVTPQSEREAIEMALENNDALAAARYRITAADFRVKAARAERNPRVRAAQTVRYFNYLHSITADLPYEPRLEGTGVEIGLTMDIPLYQGGGPASLVRRAVNERTSAVEEEIAIQRAILGRVRASYVTLGLLKLEREQAGLAVAANHEALRSATIEYEFGMRTLVEILDGRRELLRAQIKLLSIERDYLVTQFALASAIGQASPIDLGLAGAENPEFVGPQAARSSWSDWADGPKYRKVTGTTTLHLESQPVGPAPSQTSAD